jgi:IPT/TIG domain
MKSLGIHRWIRSLVQSWFSPARRIARKAKALYPLQIERLEDRVVPSGWLVTNTSNSSTTSGSLPWAVAQADTDTTNAAITFSPTAFPTATTITLASTLTLSNTAHSITIDGSGAGPITVSGGNSHEVFSVSSVVTGSISNLTIANGLAYSGSGIFNHGTLTLTNDTVSNNGAIGNTTNHFGGGIDNSGTLTISGSTVNGNSSFYHGGGIYNTGTLTMANSTIAGNAAYTDGGGISIAAGTVTLTDCTIAGNLGWNNTSNLPQYGGGINVGSGTLYMDNVIVASNTTTGAGPDVSGTIATANYCLIGTTAGHTITTGSNIITPGNANLGALANNGGPTKTMALNTGSAALGAGDPAQAGTTSQNGVVRPTTPDIGAYQNLIPPPTVTFNAANLPQNALTIMINGTDFDSNAANDTVTFDNGVTGNVFSASSTSLLVTFTNPGGVSGLPVGTHLDASVTTFAGSSSLVQVATISAAIPSPTVIVNTANIADSATSIVIFGSNFSTTVASDSVTFNNGVTGSVTAATTTQLTVSLTAPPTALGALTAVVFTVSGINSGAPVQVAAEVNSNWHVTNTNGTASSGSLASKTLPYAAAHALGGDTIDFDAAIYGSTITTSATLTLNNSVTINGPGSSVMTINGNNNHSVFAISPAATSAISGLTVTNGLAITGSGILNRGMLTLSNDAITANGDSHNTTNLHGDGIYNAGTLSISDCTIDNNASYLDGGGIENHGTMSISDSTIANNAALSYGGGIYNPAGNVTLTNVTIAGNHSWVYGTNYGWGLIGAGVFQSGGSFTLLNTIISNNFQGSDFSGSITSANYCLIANTSGTVITSGADNLIGSIAFTSTTLGNNGGGTKTLALPAGSIAVGSGAPSQAGVAAQNGIIRPTAPDIGAFQHLIPSPSLTASISNLAQNAPSIVIHGANFDTNASNDLVTFDDGITGNVSAATSTSLVVSFTNAGGVSSLPVGTQLHASIAIPYVGSSAPVQVATISAAAATPTVTPSTADFANTSTSVVINGANFDPNPANDNIAFNLGALGAVTAASSTQLTVTILAGFDTGGALTAVVTCDGLTSDPAVQVATVTGRNWVVADPNGNAGSGSSNDVTLPYAVANALGGDTITFAPNLNGSTITTNNTLTFGHGITIVGPGASNLTINGNHNHEVFDFVSGTSSLTGVTVANGLAATGAGIYNSGTLTLTNDIVTGNTTGPSGGPGKGAGIYNIGTLILTNDIVTGNSANLSGGGIFNTGAATLTSVTLSNNVAGYFFHGGGGALNIGVMTITDSSITGNAAGVGGGLENAGSMFVTHSMFSANTSQALWSHDGTTTVIASTFTGNQGGRAVWLTNSSTATTVTLIDCTIAGNSAGGIGTDSAATVMHLNLVNSTISGNDGGGLYISIFGASPVVTLSNTVVAGNTDNSNVIDVSGAVSGGSDNLIGNGAGMSGIADGANGNQVGSVGFPINPRLGNLANYGGTRQTILPEQGSPAVGAGGALTTTNAAVSNTSETTVSVANGSVFAASSLPTLDIGSYYTIQIDGEQMTVTGVTVTGDSATLTVTRGANGTVAAMHATNAAMFLVSDQRDFLPVYSNLAVVNIGAVQNIAVTSTLSFTTQPASATPGGSLGSVTVTDLAGGVPVVGATVTLYLSSGYLNGVATATTDSTGVATFSNLSVPNAGSYTLTASASGASGTTSSSFTISGPVPVNLVVTTNSDAVTHTGTSLRDAIAIANTAAAGGQSVLITFAPNLSGQTITLTQNNLFLGGAGTGTITIDGSATAPITVSGGQTWRCFMVYYNVTAVISNLTMTGGRGNGSGDGFSPYNTGGAIYNTGTLTLTNDVVTGNSVPNGSGGGGGIYNSGIAILTNVTLSNNSSVVGGGGTTNSGFMTVTNCTITGNTGDGLSNSGMMIVINSGISANLATYYGGALDAEGGTTTVIGCTFTGNQATTYQGGAIWVSSSNLPTALTVIDSTITGNTAQQGGGAIATSYFANVDLDLDNCTISGNSGTGSVGGILLLNASTVANLSNTIVANNMVGASMSDISGAVSGNNNLIGNGAGMTGITDGTNGNQVGTATNPINPLLNNLSNNGGPTQTMSEQAGSPAIGAGGTVTTVSAAIADTTTTSITAANLSLLAASPFPALSSGSYYTIQIDDEQMAVTGASSSSLTVFRGINGTTAATHASGAAVCLVADQRGYVISANSPSVVDRGAFQSTGVNDRPTITAVSPNSGSQAGGTTVIITGANFTGAGAVSFGSTAAISYTVNSDTQITAVAPAETAGTVDITVAALLGVSAPASSDHFTYLGPILTGVSPVTGNVAGGTIVTITGTGFTGAIAVKFGAIDVMAYTVNSDTQITATSPAGVGVVDVTVTTPDGTSAISSADQFTYIAPPIVTGIGPNTGPTAGGTSVVITGAGFLGATAVSFAGSSATNFTVNSATQITATAPAGAGVVDVTVTIPVGGTSATSSADQFTYIAPPTVTGLSPTSGPVSGGASVIITGTGFTGATAVKFGANNAIAFTVNSDTQITSTSPAGGGVVDVTVTIPVGGTSVTSSADQFTYSGPVVTGVNPTTGPLSGGTIVTITGTGFAGASAVKFGANNAMTYTVNSDTQITATSPPGGGSVNVTVTTPTGGTSLISTADVFNYSSGSTYIVTNTLSSGTGSLAAAVQSANANTTSASTILFDASVFATPQSIALTSSLTLTNASKPVTIQGPQGVTVTISGNSLVQDFVINTAGVVATIQNLTIANGNAGSNNGGGVAISAGNVTIDHCTISNNVAQNGGGIYVSGGLPGTPISTLLLENTLVTGNSTAGTGSGSGGGLNANGGAETIIGCLFTQNTCHGTSGGGALYESYGNMTVINSTFKGNIAAAQGDYSDYGGAIASSEAGGVYGSLYVIGCVITGNTAQSGSQDSSTGGGMNVSGYYNLNLLNDIIWGNTAANAPDVANGNNDVPTINYTLVGSTSGMNIPPSGIGNIYGVAATPVILGSLMNNGGPTQTMMPISNSPEIGAGGSVTTASAAVSSAAAATVNVANGYVFSASSITPALSFVNQPANTSAGAPMGPITVQITRPIDFQEYIQVDGEVMEVVGVTINSDGTATLNVERGVNGTTAATHAVNAPIYLISDQRGMVVSQSIPYVDMGAVQSAGTTPTAGLGLALTMGVSSGNLNGPTTVLTDASGLATFNNLSVPSMGTFQLKLAGGLATSNSFTVSTGTYPIVTGVSPSLGSPGGTVTITGTNFTTASAVNFGSTPATSYTVNSDSSITATIPAGTGLVDITVANAVGISGISTNDDFSYAPSVTSVSPNAGNAAGGTVVTITGANFIGVTGVMFGLTNAASFTVNSPTSITVTSPAGGNVVDITVIGAGGTSATSPADHFSYSNGTANWVVTNTQSTGAGSLFAAVQNANATTLTPSLITFDPTVFATPQTILLTSSLTLTNTSKPVTFLGPSNVAVTISGNNQIQDFVISNPGVVITIQNLTIANGNAGTNHGGGIDILGGAVTIDYCTISNNIASSGGGINVSSGTVLLENSQVTSNSTANTGYNTGGGLNVAGGAVTINGCLFTQNICHGINGGTGGAIFENNTVMTVVDSTFFGNTAAGQAQYSGTGGAIASTASATNIGTIYLIGCTLTGNRAQNGLPGNGIGTGGGIEMGNYYNMTLLDDIIWNNIAGNGPDLVDGNFGTPTINYTLIGNTYGSIIPSNSVGNILNVATTPAILGPLTNNGGPTQSMIPVAASPEIGAGGAVTTLSTAISNSTTTIITPANLSCLAASSLPALASGSYYTIQIGSEQLAVTAVGATTLTVVRGINGTTAANHPSGDSVYLVSDQRSYLVPANNPPVVDMGASQSTAVNETPTITAVSPNVGGQGGGVSVTITGTNFTGTTAVFFGSTAATSFTVNSNTQITAVDPAAAPGTVDVTVTTPLGTSAVSASDQYTYHSAPTVTSASPTAGPGSGGTSIIITGTGFTGATAVKFGAANATTYTVNSDSQITATSPTGAGVVDVTVTTPVGGTSGTSSADQFTYVAAPTVTSVSPNTGPAAGGTSVTIMGTGFTNANAVYFGSAAATSFTVNSDTQITANASAGAGVVDVTVAIPVGGTSATSFADHFTYGVAPSIGFFTVSPTSVVIGATVTLTASDVAAGGSATITGVNFYRESNGTSGLQFGSDTLVGGGTQSGTTWALAFVSTNSLAAGSYTYYAVATQSNGVNSAAASVLLTVTNPGPVLAWDVNGQTNYGTQGLGATTVASGVTNSLGLTRGSGVTTSGTAASNAWGGNSWASTSSEGISGNQYASFGFTVAASEVVSLSTIDMNYLRTSNGPTSGYWQYQTNGGSWILIGDFANEFSSSSSSGATMTEISLTSISGLQNLSAGTVVSIRVVPYGAHSPSGNWYVYDLSGHDLAVGGTVLASQSATTTTITSHTPNPSVTNQAVTFTVTVSGSVPNGETVTLDDASNNNAAVGTGTLSSSAATITVAAGTLSVGTHNIFAVYGGEANFAASQSATVAQTVTVGSTTTTITSNTPNPATTLQAVVFAISVSGDVPDGETVVLEDASNGNAQVGPSGAITGGVASINVPAGALSVGAHNIIAVYGGDANLAGSQSTSISQAITLVPTTTTLADNGPNPSNYGEAVSFTATVSGSSDTDGETVFIEDADAANAVVASPTLTGGSVTFTIYDLTVGTHDLFAVYNGDTTNASSNSSATPVTQVVNYSGLAPAWVSDVVNGGTPQYFDQNGLNVSLAGQNSLIEQILVTFNEPVTLDPDAFSVVADIPVTVNSGPNPNTVAPGLNAPIQIGDGHQWIITFGNSAGTTSNGNGYYVIKDGVYSVHIDHTKVHANSQTMAADVGGPGASAFWTLYGDTTFHDISGVDHLGYIGDGYSDASVGNADFQGFKACYNSDSTNYYAPPSYDVKFDANLDGSVAASDFVQFKTNYNADWQF